MEEQVKKPPFKSLSIDLIDYNDIENPMDLITEVVRKEIVRYMKQGVEIQITFEGKVIKVLQPEDFL